MPMCDFFQAPLWAITKVLPGKSHGEKLSSHIRFCAQPVNWTLRSQLQSRTKVRLVWTFSYVSIFQAHLPLFGGLLIEGTWPESFSGVSSEIFSWGKGGNLKDSIFHSNSSLGKFPLWAPPLPPALWAELHKMRGSFFSPRAASLGQYSPAVPRSLAIALNSFMEKNEMMEEELFSVKPLKLPKWLRAWLFFPFWPVALISHSNSLQLSSVLTVSSHDS